jgi:hypothetical protein
MGHDTASSRPAANPIRDELDALLLEPIDPYMYMYMYRVETRRMPRSVSRITPISEVGI